MRIGRRIWNRLRKRKAPVRPAPFVPTTLELFYWRSPLGVNFGDYLSSIVVAKMAADAGYFLDEARSRPARLLAIGSILHFARDGDVVWGSGVNGKVREDEHQFHDLDVRAVRGPLTRDFLQKRGLRVPPVYGDPGILVASLLPRRFRRPASPQTPVVHVPNLHDLPLMRSLENVVSPLDPWDSVIERIAAAGHVISSSLHGLVIADSFGIPCTYLRLSEEENLFKYEDYVLGVGRPALKVVTSVEEARRASPMEPAEPRIDALKSAFPLDLWQNR